MQTLPNGSVGIIKRHLIKHQVGTNGYLYVMLSKDGIHKSFSVHRLVAKAFVPNPNGYREVNHKDEDRTNAHADNLEWCDRHYNVHYGTGMERREKIMYSKPVERYTIDGKYIDTWRSERDFCVKNNINGDWLIGRVCNHAKGYYTAYGYRWRFVGDNTPFEEIPIGGKKVYQYTLNGEYVEQYPNASIASKMTGIGKTSITKCARGVQRTAGGYIWKGEKSDSNQISI